MKERLSKQDKEQRLRAAMFLLEQIKRQGGRLRVLAAMLKTNETQLSHWGSHTRTRRLRVGPPTRLQLRIMAGYLERLVTENLESLSDLVMGQQLGFTEKTYLLVSLTSLFAQRAEAWKQNLGVHRERHTQLVQTLRSLYEAGGFAAVPQELLIALYDIGDVPDRKDLEDGTIDFDRLLVRAEIPFMENFVNSTRAVVENAQLAFEERGQEDSGSGALDGAGPDEAGD